MPSNAVGTDELTTDLGLYVLDAMMTVHFPSYPLSKRLFGWRCPMSGVLVTTSYKLPDLRRLYRVINASEKYIMICFELSVNYRS